MGDWGHPTQIKHVEKVNLDFPLKLEGVSNALQLLLSGCCDLELSGTGKTSLTSLL